MLLEISIVNISRHALSVTKVCSSVIVLAAGSFPFSFFFNYLWVSFAREEKWLSQSSTSPFTLSVSYLKRLSTLLLLLISMIFFVIGSIYELDFVKVRFLVITFPRKLSVAQDSMKIFPGLLHHFKSLRHLWVCPRGSRAIPALKWFLCARLVNFHEGDKFLLHEPAIKFDSTVLAWWSERWKRNWLVFYCVIFWILWAQS